MFDEGVCTTRHVSEPYFVLYWGCFGLFWQDLEWPEVSSWSLMKHPARERRQVKNDFRGNCICLQPPLVNSSTPVTWWPLFGPCPSIYPEAHPSLQRSSQNCTSSAKCCSVFLPGWPPEREMSQCSSCVSVSVVLSNPCHLFLCWEMC